MQNAIFSSCHFDKQPYIDLPPNRSMGQTIKLIPSNMKLHAETDFTSFWLISKLTAQQFLRCGRLLYSVEEEAVQWFEHRLMHDG